MKTDIYLGGFEAGVRIQAAGLRPQMSREDEREWLDGYRAGVAKSMRRKNMDGRSDRRSHIR